MGLLLKFAVVLALCLAVLVASPELRGAAAAAGLNAYAQTQALLGKRALEARPSAQAQAAIALMHMLNLPTADHSGVVPSPEVLRAATEKMSLDMSPFPHLLSSCTLERGTARGIPIAWIQCGTSAAGRASPDAPPPAERRVVLYCHGGGYAFGSVEGYLGNVGNIARVWQELSEEQPHSDTLETRFLLFDYRLAPEVGMQEILDDGVAVYSWLLHEERYLPRQVIFMGDSAGGNMVHNLQHELLRVAEPLPCAGVALSPWMDMTDSTESYQRNNYVDPLLATELAFVLRDFVVPDPQDQLVYSPGLRPLEQLEHLAPTINLVGDIDILIDENRNFAKRVRGISFLEVREYPGMFHCWTFAADLMPEARESIVDAWNFTSQHSCV